MMCVCPLVSKLLKSDSTQLDNRAIYLDTLARHLEAFLQKVDRFSLQRH